MFARAELTTDPFHCAKLRKYCSRLAVSRRSGLRFQKARRRSAVATMQRICAMNSKATQATVCSPPMKQVCVCEGNTEFQLTPATTTTVRELPRTPRVYRHTGTAITHARQPFRLQKGTDIAVPCSTIHCGRDDDGCRFHCAPGWNNGGG